MAAALGVRTEEELEGLEAAQLERLKKRYIEILVASPHLKEFLNANEHIIKIIVQSDPRIREEAKAGSAGVLEN